MEDFYFEDHSTRNFFIKLLLFLLVIGICIGGFLYYRKQNIIRLKTITVEVGSKLSDDVVDYLNSGLSNASHYKLYLDTVDSNTVGEYTYKVKYNKTAKKGKIKVVDTTKPVVVLDNITIGINEEFNTNLLLVSCEDYSKPCTVSFKNERDKDKLNSAGVYTIDFNVSDSFGNTALSKATITVSETETLSSKMTNDLEYFSNSENEENLEHIFFKKLDKAIFEDTLEYEGMLQDISVMDFSGYVEKEIYSTRLITAYNQYGYVIGIQVEVTFNDGTTKLLEDKQVIDSEE